MQAVEREILSVGFAPVTGCQDDTFPYWNQQNLVLRRKTNNASNVLAYFHYIHDSQKNAGNCTPGAQHDGKKHRECSVGLRNSSAKNPAILL